MCFYILHFYHRCNQGETVNGTGRLLFKDSKLLYNIGQEKIKNSSTYYAYIKTIKLECTDKTQSIEHFQTVPHIMRIHSI